jgi:beta-lactamase class A
VAVDADSAYETFSVIKVPIMATVMQRVKEGKLSLADRIPLRLDQRRIPSGVLFGLDPGLRPTLKDLLTLMIIISDNEATDALGDLVGRDAVTRSMESLGLNETKIRFADLDWDRLGCPPSIRTTQQTTARSSSPSTSTATRRCAGLPPRHRGHRPLLRPQHRRETGRLFSSMAQAPSSPRKRRPHDRDPRAPAGNDRFPRYLGDGVRIAHKTGNPGPGWATTQASCGSRTSRCPRGLHRPPPRHDRRATRAWLGSAAVVHHYGGAVDPRAFGRALGAAGGW